MTAFRDDTGEGRAGRASQSLDDLLAPNAFNVWEQLDPDAWCVRWRCDVTWQLWVRVTGTKRAERHADDLPSADAVRRLRKTKSAA